MKPGEKTERIYQQGGTYFMKAAELYLLTEVPLEPPAQVFLSEEFSWTSRDCVVCSFRFKPATPNGAVKLLNSHRLWPICDDCLESNCPELFLELGKRRVEFDAKLEAQEKSRDKKDKETDEVKADDDDGIPF